MKKPTGTSKPNEVKETPEKASAKGAPTKDAPAKGKASISAPAKVEKVSEPDAPKLELVIDTEDIYRENTNIFYIHPARICMLQYVGDKTFDAATVKNTAVDFLTPMNFNYIMKKLKVNATFQVIVAQPLSVMQSYDAKQIEANAKLAGLDGIEIIDHEYENPESNAKVSTLLVKGARPVKNPNKIEIEIEKNTTTTTTTDKKGNKIEETKKSTVTAKAKK